MRERGADPSQIGDAKEVLVVNAENLDTSKTIKEMIREGQVWIIKPKNQSEKDQMKEMLSTAGACRWST
jgi:hypothetical protein